MSASVVQCSSEAAAFIRLFVRSFVCSFVRLFVCSFVRSAVPRSQCAHFTFYSFTVTDSVDAMGCVQHPSMTSDDQIVAALDCSGPHHHTTPPHHACTHAKVAVVMYTVVQYNYDTLWMRKNAYYLRNSDAPLYTTGNRHCMHPNLTVCN